MSYFLAEKPLSQNRLYTLSKDEARHIAAARRIKIGESIELQGPDARRFRCTIRELTKSTVVVTVHEPVPVPPEPIIDINVFQALISENALDLIIQKLTELGAHNLHIFPSQHSPYSISGKEDKKLERWQKISWEAAKQSGRAKPLEIKIHASVTAAMQQLPTPQRAILLEPSANAKISPQVITSTDHSPICVFIGPEGGFTSAEINIIREAAAATPVTLGPRILRADTASIAITAIIQSLTGDI